MRVRVEGVDLHVTVVGEGPALLTLHPIGFDHAFLRPFLDPLGADARLVHYDQRGHGRSREGVDVARLSHTRWAADADAVREALGEDRVFVLGHSYGAFLALEYALAYPDSVRGLILAGAAAALDYPEVIMENAARRGGPEILPKVQAFLTAPPEEDDPMKEGYGELLPLYFHDPDIARKQIPVMLRGTEACAAVFRHACFHCLPRYDVSDRLGQIESPTLVLAGADDWLTPLAQGAKRIASGIPNAELVVFEKSGHFPQVEETERFVDVVSQFLRAH